MLLLPIVERELRVAARNWRTYLTRVTTGGAALGFVIYLIWMVRYAMPGAMGGMFLLKATSYVAWAICVITGANRSCDTISSEKRGDTIGLLFLTHLKGYDVVLGKLLASCLSVFFLLVGVIPILSIPVLAGGVSGAELVRIPIVLINSLFIAATLGLFASSLVTTQRAASTMAGGMVVFLTVLLPAMARVFESEMGWVKVAQFLRFPSPAYSLEMAFGSSIGLSTNHFWKAVLLQFCIGLSGLMVTCWIVPRSWKVPAGNGVKVRWREKFIRWTHGDPMMKKVRRTALLAKNPLFWLSCRDRFAPVWPVVFAAVLLGAVGWCILHYEIPSRRTGFAGVLDKTVAAGTIASNNGNANVVPMARRKVRRGRAFLVMNIV